MSTPAVDRERQLKYFTRCLRSLLPHHYTPNDGNRMALGYFVISALDLLSPSHHSASASVDASSAPGSKLSAADRRRFRQGVLSCQHGGGGFCGSSSLALPFRLYEDWDFEAAKPSAGYPEQANLAATCFAVMLLALLAEDGQHAEGAFEGVDRQKTLTWLRRLQREDGSFGEVLAKVPGHGGKSIDFVAGGRDMRYCYLAALLRWILRGDIMEQDPAWVKDINVTALMDYIRMSQTYDGGIAESSQHEPHAGYAYCAISALSLLDRPAEGSSAASHQSKAVQTAIKDKPALMHWLVSRQLAFQSPRSGTTSSSPDHEDGIEPPSIAALNLEDNVQHIGYNGRCNKVVDTCYTWWVSATLSILGQNELVDRPSSRRFLVEKGQHLIGGFSKYAGGPPDVYHAYFGLAALSVLGDPTLKEIDAAVAVSIQTRSRIESGRRGLLQRARDTNDEKRIGAKILEMGASVSGERPGWLELTSAQLV